MAPWTGFLDRNRFTHGRPMLEAIVNSPYMRGALTGIGVITVFAGLAEVTAVIVSWLRRSADVGHESQ